MLAHRLAMESANIRADMVEAMEFPHLAIKYQVMAVPHTVINEKTYIDAAVSEAAMVQAILKALGKEPPKP